MNWNNLFNEINKKDYYKNLMSFLDLEYANKTIFPERKNLFKAFELTPLDKVKVVILGQDPYHEKGQAMGLCFSVPKEIEIPPSLVNIYKEISKEYNVNEVNKNGDLTYLAKQGVLLLNPILSVEEHKPLSHKCADYNCLFNDIMDFLDKLDQPIVFMLWGNNAKAYKKFINNKNRLILESVHPSPLSANRGGWFGNNHFVLCNDFLKQKNVEIIDWINK